MAAVDPVVSHRSVSPRPPAPRTSDRGATVAPADDPAPAPVAPSSAAAATSGSAAGATAFLALLVLWAPRFGALIRLSEVRAPMPPLLAIPERPG
jgi:hypothetical protein